MGRGAAHNLNVSERGEAAGHLGEVDHVVAPLDELVREVEYQLVLHRPRQRVLFVLLGELYMKGELDQNFLAMKFTTQHVLY